MLAHVTKAGELIVFGEIVEERTKRGDDKREAFGQREAAHVAYGHLNALLDFARLARELPSQPVEHRWICIERVDRHAVPGDPERDASSARA